ncbi:Fc.00g004880.m01.CDS01 [Cosmosporella sp. VM-42]
MASSVPASTLESLPARPPTPPRETHNETEVSLKAVLTDKRTKDPRSSLHTPPNVHSPSNGGALKSNLGSSRLRKKVEWSNHTEYKDPPEYRQGIVFGKSSPLSAPLSASSKPVKGILKPSASPNPLASSLSSQLDGLATQANITEMLDSTIKQLAGSDRDSRLDAYMILSRALKASNNLPDRVALQDKMSLFMQFIQRDLTSKNDKGLPDTSLVNHALNLLTTFLHFQAIASTLSSDFGVFIIDHCIRYFEDTTAPKELIRHLMQVVAFQSFSAKVMTSDRVGRLVASLHKIEDHMTGKSVVMGRIHVYKRLLKQSRIHMAVHTDWLKDMFTDMLSTVRDIRTQAISLGTDAGFILRNEKQVMRKVTEIFQTTDDDHTYIEFYMQRLEEMIRGKQCPSAAPQIWSVIILYLRCPLDRWQYFSPWLKLAQSAFNTTDGQTKQEANYAWNRYVYLSLVDGKMAPKGLTLLTQPLISQLRRKFNAKQVDEGKKLRRVVIGGICNLCYYAFRPSHDKGSTDSAWDLTIQPIMTQLISLEEKPEAYGDSMMQASRILAGLLDVSTPRGWKEERIKDMSLISPEELPGIDPKWTRRNSEKVFQVVGPILETKFTDLANNESITYRLWQTLVGSIAAASAKDIKVSEDTAKFFACAFGFLFKIWSKGCSEAEEPLNPKFLPSVRNFTRTLTDTIGLLPFTEKKLSMSVANTFEPAATPSHRPDRVDQSRGVVRAPVYHLFSMLSSIPPGGADDETLSEFLQSVFEPFFTDKSTKSRIELAREMLRLLPRNTLSPYGPWILAAQNVRLSLEQTHVLSSPAPTSSDRLLGPEYREIVSLLERGLVSHPNLPSQHWFSLFNLLSEHVVQECGDAGRALGLVEPLAKIILDNFFSNLAKPNETALDATTTLYEIAKFPRDRQAVEVARRRLWGAPPTVTRASSFDPFDNLYKLGTQCMAFLYEQLVEQPDRTAVAIETICGFLKASFSQTGIKTLLKLQEGISPWIQDDKAQLKLGDQSPVSNSLRTIWNAICEQLTSLGHLDKSSFALIEPLLTAGFKSKHRYIVNKTAETWNMIVKDEEELECSDSLKSIVTSLRPKVDLAMPGMEQSSGEFGAQATSFIESQNDLSFIALSSTKSSRQEVELATPPVLSISKAALRGPMTRKRRRDATPEVGKSKPAKRTSTPRLRHDSSQINFAPIQPSPLVEESQHLTERQQEVRQRQKHNAVLYPNMRSSPRTRSRAALEEKSKPPLVGTARPKQSTPEPTTSYEDFITSTPTPRRGQAIHLDDDNDPPSSPPEPRRYPLLSEIQTRSRVKDSLENWEFSSPPGTPTTSRQQDHHDAELPHIVLTDDSTQHKVHEQVEAVPDDMEVVPSSAIIEDDIPSVEEITELPIVEEEEEVSSELSDVPADLPTTPPDRHTLAASHVQETPKSGDDEFVDARSSPEQPSPSELVAAAHEKASSPNKDTSFYLSEGDESSMMRFVVELESRRCNLPFDKVNSVSVSPEKKKANEPVVDCITVSSSPPENGKKEQKRSVSPVIPSTPTKPTEEASQSQSQGGSQGQTLPKRKRKRAAKFSETRRKKRRSSIASDKIDDSQPMVSEGITSDIPGTRQSPRRTAALRTSKNQDRVSASSSPEEVASAPEHKVASSKGADGCDGGDTDEELMSQLVTESFAASQTQGDGPAEGYDLEDSMDLVCTGDERPEASTDAREGEPGPREKGPGAGSKASTIMEMLRCGLNELRGAALSREEVYQLEDTLMDMKRELYSAERRGRS